jgi:hypothetical protein
MPVSVLIDRDGKMADLHAGVVERDNWEEKIEKLLRETENPAYLRFVAEWRGTLTESCKGGFADHPELRPRDQQSARERFTTEEGHQRIAGLHWLKASLRLEP